MSSLDLENMRYADLQKMAKSLGVKANQKMDKLIAALKESMSKIATDGEESYAVKDIEKEMTQGISHSQSRNISPESIFDETEPMVQETVSTLVRTSTRKSTSPSVKPDSLENCDPGATLPLLNSSSIHLLQTIPSPTIRNKLSRLSYTKHPVVPSECVSSLDAVEMKPIAMEDENSSIGPVSIIEPLYQTPSPTTRRKSSRLSYTKYPVVLPEGVVSSLDAAEKKTMAAEDENTKQQDGSREQDGDDDDEIQFRPTLKKLCMGLTTPGIAYRRSTTNSAKKSEEFKRKQSVKAVVSEAKRSLAAVKPIGTETKPALPVATRPTQIPSFCGLKVRKPTGQFTPAYWAKIHAKGFDKMDSIDVYMEKKKQRVANNTTTPNTMEKPLQSSLKKSASTFVSKGIATTFVPKAIAPTFVPKVTSTINLDLNFRQMYQSNDRATTFGGKRKSIGVLNGSVGMNDSSTLSTRPKFDLEASLARPLTWKPHVGALKPLNPTPAAVTHEKRNVKEVKVIGRDERRQQSLKARKAVRSDANAKRRQL